MVCGIAVLHLITVLILLASRESLLSLQPAQGAEALTTSIFNLVLRILLFPIVELLMQSGIQLPRGWLIGIAVPLNSLVWAVCIAYMLSQLQKSKTAG